MCPPGDWETRKTHWKSPPLVGIFGASPHVGRKRECVVVDAAPIEPVSSIEIPRKLGKYWEFRPFWTLRGPNRRAVSKVCRQNSRAGKLGIYFKEMGKRKTARPPYLGWRMRRTAAVPERQAPHCWRMWRRSGSRRWPIAQPHRRSRRTDGSCACPCCGGALPRHRAVQQWGLALRRVG